MGVSVDISVVVPTFRNARVLPELVERLDASLGPLAKSYEIILIDDGNTDNTWSVIEALSGKHPSVRGLRLSRNFGQHPAISAGFHAARGARIVLMDADLEDRPEALPELLAKLDEGGVDVVFTIIANPYEHARRRVSSDLFRHAFAAVGGVQMPQNVGTLRVFTRQVLDAMLQYREYNVLYGPLMFFMGFRFVCVPVKRGASAAGSSYSFVRRLRLAASTFVSYTNLPNNLFLAAGGVLLGLVGLYILLVLTQYLFFPAAAPRGVVLLALLTAGGVAVNLIAFGVIGTYVYRVYQEVLARPRYHIMAVTGRAAEEEGVIDKRG